MTGISTFDKENLQTLLSTWELRYGESIDDRGVSIQFHYNSYLKLKFWYCFGVFFLSAFKHFHYETFHICISLNEEKKVASQKWLNLPLFYNHFVFFKEKICFVLSLALLSEQKSNLNVENVDIIVMKTVNTFLMTLLPGRQPIFPLA